MIDNSTNSKLDEAVKTTLNDYEAPFEPSDWARMESMLDAAPKSTPFKWSYAIGAVVGVVVIGGIYLAVSGGSSTTTDTSTTTPTIEKVQPVVTAPVKTTPPPVNNTAITTNETPAVSAPAVTETAVSKNETVIDPKIKPEDKVIAKEDRKKEDKKSKKTTNKEEDVNLSNVPIMGMGNEPVFGDMLDSSKGIVGETKEKEETKKAAKAHKNTPVGWNNIMSPNVNPDSLRK